MEIDFQVGNEYYLNLYRRELVTVIAKISDNTVVCLLNSEEYKTITIDTSYLEEIPLQPARDFSDLGM